MTDETDVTAATPAAGETMPAEQTPAQDYEQPAATQEQENYEEQYGADPADLGEILQEHLGQERPKKLSGAQRAKLQRQYLENELAAREQRIQELERHIGERDANERQSEADRQAEAQRKRDEAHRERVNGAKTAIPDFDRVMASMRGKTIHEDLLGDVLASEKSALLAYHLASNPDQLEKLNTMSERDRVREIGRLEGTLKMPAGKKLTTAPPPPATLRGGAAPHRALEQVDDMKEFSQRLLEDLANRRR